jgi:hypothetical protein
MRNGSAELAAESIALWGGCDHPDQSAPSSSSGLATDAFIDRIPIAPENISMSRDMAEAGDQGSKDRVDLDHLIGDLQRISPTVKV